MSSLPLQQAISTTLNLMKVGDSGVVEDVQEQGDAKDESLFNITRRLKELGFVKGESVKILHKGYFGGEPLAVRIGQSTFALRNFEAALIGVTPGHAPISVTHSGKVGT
ncbi:FeoA family protein [Undibacterium pigrum]|uniref:Ferrous iron transport protein A n=1 Tax=Undibacterium pigrum TaxID=401470 RepID=A0A318JI58_9BURK|nr:FeoA family protein [Undibacterium pigrum]PXX46983.1 ferrous iron transport protein A [Undibacterium pigrum]